MSRSEETEPKVVFSLEIVMWEGDEAPGAEELEQAVWAGLRLLPSTEDEFLPMPAAIYVKPSPFNPTGGESNA
jgi:hypothetical protein